MPDGAAVVIDRRYHDAVLLDVDCLLTTAELPSTDGTVLASTSVDLLRRLADLGLVTVAYWATTDGDRVPPTPGLSDLVTVQVDDIVAAPATDDSGQADPTALLQLAHRARTRPDRCVLVESSCGPIAAARAAGFGLIVGVSRTRNPAELRAAGADVVIADAADIDTRKGDRRISALPDALDSTDQIDSVLAGRSPAVFLDFDGTLSRIVEDPAAATLVPGAAAALQALSAVCPVAIISGRGLPDVRAKVGLPGLWYAGSHGLELLDPDGRIHRNHIADGVQPQLSGAIADLHRALDAIPGVLVEDKPLSVAVHYRNAADDRGVEAVAAAQLAGRRHQLRVTHGRKVVELRPAVHWDKGEVVKSIVTQIISTHTMVPVYIGDDLTDEDALDTVKREGVGVLVRHAEDGDRCTAARFTVQDPDSVVRLLTHLATQLSPTSTIPDGWSMSFDGYQPQAERLRETLCAVGNGALASRAAAPECGPTVDHYPGTYAAGVYNRLSDVVDGMPISNESIVNLPNWLPLTFRIDGGTWFDLDGAALLSYRQSIDIRHAECSRELRFQDTMGRRTRVVQRRFVSMHDPHVCALQMTLVAENWSGNVDIRSTIDTGTTNAGVARYQALSGQHLDCTTVSELPGDGVLVDTRTVQSRIPIAVATRTTVWQDDRAAPTTSRFHDDRAAAGHDISTTIVAGRPLTIEKCAAIFTGHDRAISAPRDAAAELLPDLGRYGQLFDEHRTLWAQLWRKFDFGMPAAAESEKILRLHIMHLLQSVPGYITDRDAGIPARGLHGEGYRGHIFWDELFIIPLLTLRLPQASRSALAYRSRRLPQARRAAHAAGYSGAMFPWQSGSDGSEQSQLLHLNPLSGRWIPDSSRLAHHIGSAVAYTVWHYYQITGDRQYLIARGAEVLVEIARFWASRAHYDEQRHRYVIDGVIGPDEFHSGYPDNPGHGINNNAYTNVMAVWVILRAFDVLDALPLPYRLDLLDRLHINATELDRWDAVSKNMFVPFHDGVISQFEGYQDLAELDWASYRRRYGDIGRLDRILESENDDVNRYRAAKQADVLMLFYLLSADELREIFTRLGYHFRPQQIPKTVEYYAARTSHGSTLSAVVHSWVSARGDRDQAMQYFAQVLKSDVADIQGGTTAEGVHLAAMAGSVDLLQRCFTGLETRGDRLVLGPMWPETEGELTCSLWYRGHRLHVVISGREADVTADPTGAAAIEVECRGHVQRLASGQSIHIR